MLVLLTLGHAHLAVGLLDYLGLVLKSWTWTRSFDPFPIPVLNGL